MHAKRKRPNQNHGAGQHTGIEGTIKKRKVDAESHVSHENSTVGVDAEVTGQSVCIVCPRSDEKGHSGELTYTLKHAKLNV